MLTPRNLIAAATVGLIYALPVPSAHAQAAPKTNLTIEAHLATDAHGLQQCCMDDCFLK